MEGKGGWDHHIFKHAHVEGLVQQLAECVGTHLYKGGDAREADHACDGVDAHVHEGVDTCEGVDTRAGVGRHLWGQTGLV